MAALRTEETQVATAAIVDGTGVRSYVCSGRDEGRDGRGGKGGRDGGREDGKGEEHCMTTFYSVKFTLLGILHATIRHWSISICIAIYGKQLLAWGRAVDMRMRAADYKY